MDVQEMVKGITDRVASIATVNTVFGEARVMHDRAIIPIAVVAGGFGAGGDSHIHTASPMNEVETEGSIISGGGGGGYAIRPIALLEVTEGHTRLIPVLDTTRIILASMGLVGGVMWAIARICKSRHR